MEGAIQALALNRYLINDLSLSVLEYLYGDAKYRERQEILAEHVKEIEYRHRPEATDEARDTYMKELFDDKDDEGLALLLEEGYIQLYNAVPWANKNFKTTPKLINFPELSQAIVDEIIRNGDFLIEKYADDPSKHKFLSFYQIPGDIKHLDDVNFDQALDFWNNLLTSEAFEELKTHSEMFKDVEKFIH